MLLLAAITARSCGGGWVMLGSSLGTCTMLTLTIERRPVGAAAPRRCRICTAEHHETHEHFLTRLELRSMQRAWYL